MITIKQITAAAIEIDSLWRTTISAVFPEYAERCKGHNTQDVSTIAAIISKHFSLGSCDTDTPDTETPEPDTFCPDCGIVSLGLCDGCQALRQEASSKCPVCGVDSQHTHTRKSIAQDARERELHKRFEATLEMWWNKGLRNMPGSYGMSICKHYRNWQANSTLYTEGTLDGEEYAWWPVQLLWQVFSFFPLNYQPELPDDGIPDINEALAIKQNPWGPFAGLTDPVEVVIPEKLLRNANRGAERTAKMNWIMADEIKTLRQQCDDAAEQLRRICEMCIWTSCQSQVD